MLWHCDTLTTGPASPKFKALAGYVHHGSVNHDYVFELAILLATPGVTELDVRNWFRRKVWNTNLRWVAGLGLDVAELGRENASSVTREDAWAMLALTPRSSRPGVYGRALIVELGETAVARRLGVKVETVQLWKWRSTTLLVG